MEKPFIFARDTHIVTTSLMTNKEEKTLILVNLGGPRSSSEIEIFLRDLFSDPFVFDLPLPEFLRIRLARFIAKKRSS